MYRCEATPVIVATESEAGKDGRHGSMALCADCRRVFENQMPKVHAFFTSIEDTRKILESKERLSEKAESEETPR